MRESCRGSAFGFLDSGEKKKVENADKIALLTPAKISD